MTDAGCHTGFGNVMHNIGERLVRDYGHDIHVLAVNYRGDYFPSILEPDRPTYLKLYNPTKFLAEDLHGQTRVIELLGMLGETPGLGLDVVFMLTDPQVLLQLLFENNYDKDRYLLRYRPIVSYVPCDGTNLPPAWTETLPRVTNVVAMSKWGQQHYPGSKLVYHGVDSDKFYPVSEKPITMSSGQVIRSKRDAKRAFGFDPKSFVIGRVDKNSGRKDWGALLRTVGPLMQKYSDIEFYAHCAATENVSGVNIPLMFTRFLDADAIKRRVHQPGLHNTFIGWSQEDMNALYNAFDIFVSTSRGEGFGMTLSEAAACGVPIVAQNVSAIPEVVGPGGILVEPSGVMVTVPSGEDLWMPDVAAFSEAIERLYHSSGLRRDLGEQGVAHVRQLTWDYATERMDEFIRALATASNPEEVPVSA
jgi:glycosyltransferase involved in cell wall biosynthesis